MKPDVHAAADLFGPEPPNLAVYGRRLLAEGDSWFSIGTLNLAAASNLLFKLEFARSTAVVNCARAGDTLAHMVNGLQDPHFDRLLRAPAFARWWEAILVSGGGNDLVDAAQVPPADAQGQPIAADRRLLLTPAEAARRGDVHDPAAYVSAGGWARLERYLRANFAELVRRRDQGPSAGRPLFVHTYAVPTVRPAGTLDAPQGWLHPAFVAAGIAAPLRQPIADRLFARLRAVLRSLDQGSGQRGALPQVHVFDSAAVPDLVPAEPGSTGASHDWVNEIHPTPRGYAKLGRPFGAFVDAVLAGYP